MPDDMNADAPTDILTAIGRELLGHEIMRVCDDIPDELEDKLYRLDEAFARYESAGRQN